MKTYGECAYPGLYPKLPGNGFWPFAAGGISRKRNQVSEGASKELQELVTGMTAAQEQKREIHSIDDVTALAAEQLKKILPPDDETKEQFQRLMKKMLKQAGK